jgi:hypothetical protein
LEISTYSTTTESRSAIEKINIEKENNEKVY